MRRRFAPLHALPIALLAAAWAAPIAAQDPGQWGFYSANKQATRYSPLAQIDSSNVGRLAVAWRHKQVDPAILAANPDFSVSNRWMVTPIYVDGLMYVPNGFGLAEAVDPKTGRTCGRRSRLSTGLEGYRR